MTTVRATRLIALTATGLLSGCSPAPRYVRLDAPVPEPLATAGGQAGDAAMAVANGDIEVGRHESAIQTASGEVADALAERETPGRRLQAQQALVEASSGSVRLSQARFERAAGSRQGAWDAQRALCSAEQVLTNTRLSRLTHRVAHDKALGGGWVEQVTAPGALASATGR